MLVLSILVRWVLIAVAVVLAAWATPDVELESDVTSVVVVSVLIALANVLAQLALRLLPLPRSLILLAVVTLVVNGLAVLLVSAVTSRFQVDGLLAAVTFAVLLSRVQLASFDLSALRYVTQASGAMPPALTQRLRETLPHTKVFVMYGQTEATARLTWLPPERLTGMAGIHDHPQRSFVHGNRPQPRSQFASADGVGDRPLAVVPVGHVARQEDLVVTVRLRRDRAGLLRHPLERRHPAHGIEGDVARADTVAARRESVTDLMQGDAREDGEDEGQIERERYGRGPRQHTRDQYEQRQEPERPVDIQVDPEELAELE